MTAESKVYIAGVGYSPSSSRDSNTSLVSAATKALLDAGVTYDDVTQGVGSVGNKTFKAFDEEGGVNVDKVKSGSELDSSIRWVSQKGSQCVLTIAVEKSAAVAFVLVSGNFLRRHPYLKDSSATIRKADTSRSKSEGKAKEGLYDICQIVWSLRGWSDTTRKGESLYYKGTSNQFFEFSRADEKDIPDWKEVEYKQDGKHRLGYNPASETKDISQEDFEIVRSTGQKRNESDDRSQFKRKGGDRAALAKL